MYDATCSYKKTGFGLGLWGLMPQYFSYILEISFIGG